MTWVRLDDQFADHPKIVGLSASAFRLHVTAICYAARQETDGVIPRAAAFVVKRIAGELVAAGLWDAHPRGYVVHDYLDYNPSASELLSKRHAKRMAGAKGAASRWHGEGNAPGPARPDPVPLQPDLPPNPPASRGARANRAKAGSKRKRDVIAMRAEKSTQSPEERYLGKERAAAFKARPA